MHQGKKDVSMLVNTMFVKIVNDITLYIQAFQEEGCVLPSHTSPNDLLSITTFTNTEESLTTCDKPEHSQRISKEMVATGVTDEKDNDQIKDNDDTHDKETDDFNSNTKHSLGKRKLVTDEGSIKIKKRRQTADRSTMDQHNSDAENGKEISNKDVTNRNKITETDRKRKKKLSMNDTCKLENISEETVKRDSRGSTKLDKNKATEMSSADKNYDDNNEKGAVSQSARYTKRGDIDTSSKKEICIDERKKKKNRKKRNNFQRDITSDMMQVMAKRDWKRLRNKYLELQKSKMQQLKLHLKKARWNYDKAGQNCLQMEKSKYEADEKSSGAKTSCYGRTAYAPGIIVKIEMNDPCVDPQGFKVYIF